MTKPRVKVKTVNVKDFGAKGDAITDDTDAIGRAIAEVAVSGGIVYFPDGIYNQGQSTGSLMGGPARAR